MYWWEQYHNTATPCYRIFRPQQPWQILVRCVLVNTLQHHDTVGFCINIPDGRSTVGSGARRGTKPWQDNGKELMRTQQWDHDLAGSTSKFLSANTGAHVPTMETRSSTLAGDIIIAEEPAREMAFETAQRRELGLQLRSSWTICWCRMTVSI